MFNLEPSLVQTAAGQQGIQNIPLQCVYCGAISHADKGQEETITVMLL